MELLKQKILEEATVTDGDMIGVDMFLNHQLDIPLLEAVGSGLAKKFRNKKITKVLTAESSGIPIAIFVGRALGVPVIFAKKFSSGHIHPDVYSSAAHSFALDKTYTLRVAKQYLTADERVLVVDDILANGQTVFSLIDLVSQAGGQVMGVGVAIEKATREGGKVVRKMDIPVEALVTVTRIEDEKIYFE